MPGAFRSEPPASDCGTGLASARASLPPVPRSRLGPAPAWAHLDRLLLSWLSSAMSALLPTMVPVFGLMGLGAAAVRFQVVDSGAVSGLVAFVFTFAIPALLLTSVATLDVPDDASWGFLIAYYGGSLLTYGLGVLVGGRGFGRSLADQAIFGLGASFSNLFLIGLPVVLTALGPEASFPMLVIVGFHSATFMPLAIVMIQAGRTGRGVSAAAVGAVLKEVVRNPIIVALMFGAVLNVTGVGLRGPLVDLLDLLGDAAIPCALFALGGSLAGYSAVGAAVPSAALTCLKLVVHPLIVWALAVPVLGLSGMSVSVAVLLAGMPSAVFVYLLGARYQAAVEVAARTVLLTSLGSFVSLAVILILLRA
jgi:malonate transporter